MIWSETSPEATRLQVVFRSNQKKTNKQKNHRCKSQNDMLSVCKLVVLNAWVQCKTRSQYDFQNIHEEDIVHLKRMERKYDFNLLKGLEEVFYRQKVLEFSLR